MNMNFSMYSFNIFSVQLGFNCVYGCEVDEKLCKMSNEIAFEKLKLSPKEIKFINKYSTKLKDSDFDLENHQNDGKVDVIVTELFDSSFFGERVASCLIHAIEKFLKPGGIVIPSSAKLRFSVIFRAVDFM